MLYPMFSVNISMEILENSFREVRKLTPSEVGSLGLEGSRALVLQPLFLQFKGYWQYFKD